MILSIAMLGMGTVIVRKFYVESTELQKQLSEQQEREISALMNRGVKVGIPANTKTIQRKQDAIFGLGILNVGQEGDFEINSRLLSSPGVPPEPDITIIEEKFNLKANDQGFRSLF